MLSPVGETQPRPRLQRAFLRALRCKLARMAVGGIQLLKIQNLLSCPFGINAQADHRLHQAVGTGNQPVSTASRCVDLKSPRAQTFNMLPDRRTGHAKLLAERLPGNRTALKQPPEYLFRHLYHSISISAAACVRRICTHSIIYCSKKPRRFQVHSRMFLK